MLEIAGEIFKDKKALLDFIHQILQKSPINKILTDKASRVIGHMLTYHPEYKQKTEAGLKYLCVGIHKKSGGRAFCIITKDGKKDTFSIKKCVSGWIQHIQKQQKENTKKHEKTKYQLSLKKPKTTQLQQTQREKILAFLKDTPKQRKDIIQHIYGPKPKPWQAKYAGNHLSRMLKKGDVHRVKTGVYALGNGIPIPKKKTHTQLQTDIKNTLKTGEKRRAAIIQSVYGDNAPHTHTQHVQLMLAELVHTGELVKVRHGTYALGTQKGKQKNIQERLQHLQVKLAKIQKEIQDITQHIETDT